MQANISSLDTLFYVLILVFSIIVHEIAHAVAADKLGDSTARMEGRITLNPIAHIDLFGSIILPLLLVVTGSPVLLGWAKPVPFNPLNFRQTVFIKKYGEAVVALAGPLVNIIIALIFGLILRFYGSELASSATLILSLITFTNILLAVFNLMPVAPLDGSKVLFAFLPFRFRHIRDFLERNALILSLLFIFFVWQYIFPVVISLFNLIIGQ